MKKNRIKRIEKYLATDLPDDGARQAITDQVLRNLHRIYGDPDTPVPKMDRREFDEMVQTVFDKMKS